MTTSGVNPGSGPLNALAALGQQQSRDGSGKHAGLDFAGLLSRLSAAVEPGSDAKSDQAQSLVAGAAVDTLAAQRNLPSSGPSIALVKDPQRSLDGEDKPIVQAEAEASIIVADDAAIDVEGSKETIFYKHCTWRPLLRPATLQAAKAAPPLPQSYWHRASPRKYKRC